MTQSETQHPLISALQTLDSMPPLWVVLRVYQVLGEDCEAMGEIRSLVADLRHACEDDPVGKRILDSYPVVGTLFQSLYADNASSPQAPKLSRDEEAAVGIWILRVCRATHSLLDAFVQREDYENVVYAVITSGDIGNLIEFAEAQTGNALARLDMPNSWDIQQRAWREMLHTATDAEVFRGQRHLVEFILETLLDQPEHEPTLRFFRAVVADAYSTENYRALHDMCRWYGNVCLDNPADLFRPALKKVLKRIYSPSTRETTMRATAEFLARKLASSVGDELSNFVSDDVNVLSIDEAAAYLGIKPPSLHAHIQRRANTDAAVPATMVNREGKRSQYVIHLHDLQAWERDHWKPIRRRRRRAKPRG